MSSTHSPANPPTNPRSISDRFRFWYEYEKDCNAKTLKMLDSVPEASRSSPQFARAVGKFAHMVAARHMWLFRLGVRQDKPDASFPDTPLDMLPALVADVEKSWTDFLATLDDESIYREFQTTLRDGHRYRWPLIELLTQVFGHAWYHRGQVAMLVKDLGGVPLDTDFIFWNWPTKIE